MARADLPYDEASPASFSQFLRLSSETAVQQTIINFGPVLTNDELRALTHKLTETLQARGVVVPVIQPSHAPQVAGLEPAPDPAPEPSAADIMGTEDRKTSPPRTPTTGDSSSRSPNRSVFRRRPSSPQRPSPSALSAQARAQARVARGVDRSTYSPQSTFSDFRAHDGDWGTMGPPPGTKSPARDCRSPQRITIPVTVSALRALEAESPPRPSRQRSPSPRIVRMDARGLAASRQQLQDDLRTWSREPRVDADAVTAVGTMEAEALEVELMHELEALTKQNGELQEHLLRSEARATDAEEAGLASVEALAKP